MVNIMQATAVNGVLGVAVMFVIISAGIDLSVGTMMTLTAVMAGLILTNLGMPLPFGIAGAMLFGACMGAISGRRVTIGSTHSTPRDPTRCPEEAILAPAVAGGRTSDAVSSGTGSPPRARNLRPPTRRAPPAAIARRPARSRPIGCRPPGESGRSCSSASPSSTG